MTTAYLVDTGRGYYTGKKNSLGHHENVNGESIARVIGWAGFASKASATRTMNELKAIDAELFRKAHIVAVEYETHLRGVELTRSGLRKWVNWEVVSISDC